MKQHYKEKGKIKIAVDIIRTYKEYLGDAYNYMKYSMLMNTTAKNYEYQIMLRMHGLEKGMCMTELRPFGQKKIEALVGIMNKAKSTGEITTGYKMAEGVIKEWVAIFEKNGWTDDKTYQKIKADISSIVSDDAIDSGIKVMRKVDVEKDIKGNFEQLCFSRNSVRKYEFKELSKEDIQECITLAKKSPTACNRQMCKVYQIRDAKRRKTLESIGLGLSGFDNECNNYFVVTYDIKGFNYYGERNQGYFNAGLFVMNLIYAFHYKGIGSCCLQWGKSYKDEKRIKKEFDIPADEKIVVVLAAGYYPEESIVPVSHRRNNDEIYSIR